jgi:hypothetical protein
LWLLWWGGALNRYTVILHWIQIVQRTSAFYLTMGGSANPRGRRAAPSPLSSFIAREPVLDAAVFACTAVLVDSTPPRHVEHGDHRAGSSASQLSWDHEDTIMTRIPARRHSARQFESIPCGRVLRRAPQAVFDPERGEGLGIRPSCRLESLLSLKGAQGGGSPGAQDPVDRP